jgi:hypothetical protein
VLAPPGPVPTTIASKAVSKVVREESMRAC